MTLVVALALRSSIVLALGLLLSAALAKRSAALRHRVLAFTVLAAASVVPLSVALPEWTVTLPAVAVETAPLTQRSLVTDTVREVTAPPEGASPTSPPAAPSPPPSLAAPLLFVWLAGVALVGGVLISAIVRVRRVAARAARVEDAEWLRILQAVAARYGLRRDIALARTDSAQLLGTWGVVRPQVLLPRHAREWPLDRVRVVLCHELAHIRRHDWLVQMAAEALRAVLWFNPLAWMVCRRLRRESEQACDDEVLGTGVSGGVYAADLLALARECRRSGSLWAPALPMAHPSTLERRIAAMLNPRLDRRTPSRRTLTAVAAIVLLAALPAALVRARQAVPAPVSGTVYDVSGGVLPAVQVTLVDATDTRWTATSNASGRFELPAVGPGKYLLEAALAGFRPLRQEFDLREARDWERAITLQVGQLQETVVVAATRPAGQPDAAPRAERSAVRVGGNVRAPRKQVHVAPLYPEAMREAGLSGVVPVEAVIGRDGSVSSVRVLSAQVHPDFAVAAVDAVRQWRFTPTLLNGEAVEVVMTVSVRFDLEG